MLVLSRKTGERVQIGEDIVVTIVRVGPNSVRLGIEAPRDMSVLRDELQSLNNGSSSQDSSGSTRAVG